MPLKCTAPSRSTAVTPDASPTLGQTIWPSIAIARARPRSRTRTAGGGALGAPPFARPSASVKAAAKVSLASAGGVCLGRGCQLACVLLGGVEVHTRSLNGAVQVVPVTVAQRARPAVHQECGHGGAGHCDRLVVPQSKR
jgi:hypothetical protein